MNTLKRNWVKIAGLAGGLAGALGLGLTAFADYSTTTISSAFSDTLNLTVQAIIGTVITFFTNNLPLIVVLGVAIAMVLYFVRKARSAGKGR